MLTKILKFILFFTIVMGSFNVSQAASPNQGKPVYDSMVAGNPTGGNKGTGSLNVQNGVYINGTLVLGSGQGPCDILAAAGDACVAAHSVTRSLFGAYTGPLFQLTRASDSTTVNVFPTSTGLYNAATVASFCLGTSCYFSEIYDQTSNNNNLPANNAVGPAPWLINWATGLPVIMTAGGSAYLNRLNTTNLPSGASAFTGYYVRGTDNFSSCCGDYGRVETNGSNIVGGDSWEMAYSSFGQNGSGLPAWGVDMEQLLPSIELTSTPTIGLEIGKYKPTGNIMTVGVWDVLLNKQIGGFSGNPPLTLNTQTGLALGTGGDGTLSDSEFFEGAVISGTTSHATDIAVASNITSFYGTQKPAYIGPVDVTINQVLGTTTGPMFAVQYAWGLRKLSASYTGYAATLRRASDGTSQSIGFTSSGDFDDSAAQSFCSGTTCTAVTLFNQAIPVGNTTGSPAFDMAQPTVALQPTISFNSLNQKTVLTSDGTRYMCLPSTISSLTAINHLYEWSFIVVANRPAPVSGTYTVGYALSINPYYAVGFAASANQTYAFLGTWTTVRSGVPSTPFTITGTLPDVDFGELSENVTGANSGSLTINNGTPTVATTTTTGSLPSTAACLFGVVGAGGLTNPLAGSIAEALLAVGPAASTVVVAPSAAQLTAIYNNEHNYYAGGF